MQNTLVMHTFCLFAKESYSFPRITSVIFDADSLDKTKIMAALSFKKVLVVERELDIYVKDMNKQT